MAKGDSPAPLRVGLVGYGLAGRVFHGPLVRANPGLELVAIATRSDERRHLAARDFPAADIVDDVTDLVALRTPLDLVIVASIPAAHATQAAVAVDAGLPVVVEKPLAVSVAEAEDLVARAAAAGVLVVPFHNRRWDSDQLTLRRLVDAGELGDVLRYESRFERWRPDANPQAWREATAATEGGGVLLDLGIHLVDQALQLFGPVTTIHAEVASRRGGADDDVFLALRHSGGVESHLWASAVCAAPGPRLRVLGSRGAYVVDDLDRQEKDLRAGLRPGEEGFGVDPPQRWGRLLRGDVVEPVSSEPGRWSAFYTDVETSLRTGAPPPVSAADALAALEVLETARRQAQAAPHAGRESG